MIWQAIAEQQAKTIDDMSSLCRELIDELSQYKNIDAEEQRLKEITKEDKK